MKRFSRSVLYAARGMRYAFKTEKNFRIEVVFALAVLSLMYLLKIHFQEKLILVLVIAGVLVLELLNTAIERVVDMLKPRVHPYARVIKDMMAAAVLIFSFGAMVIGTLILAPYLIDFYIEWF